MRQTPISVAPAPVFDDAFRGRLVELFKWRRDVRSFQTKPVAADLLDGLLELTALAPSVGLSQPSRFVIVDEPATRAAIKANFENCNARALASQDGSRAALYAKLKLAGLDQAPIQIAVCAESDPEQGHGLGRVTMPETTAYSAVMAIHTLWLAARAVGLGVGWVSILDPETVLAALDLPDSWRLIGYFCVGYPAMESEIPELERLGWENRRSTKPTVVRR
jgi:5,6-dimethylbenzimidazole synthase